MVNILYLYKLNNFSNERLIEEYIHVSDEIDHQILFNPREFRKIVRKRYYIIKELKRRSL